MQALKDQVSGRLNSYHSVVMVSQIRRKNKDAPNLGTQKSVQNYAVRDLEHFRKWCRPEIYWHPIHSAQKTRNGWGTEVYSES
jgi:hypothetical protein